MTGKVRVYYKDFRNGNDLDAIWEEDFTGTEESLFIQCQNASTLGFRPDPCIWIPGHRVNKIQFFLAD